MSQHVFRTTFHGQPVSVTMGWDRQLDGFFMTIIRSGDVIYSNLTDQKLVGSGGMAEDLNYLREVLAGMGVIAPESVFDEIAADAEQGVGNRYRHYLVG